MTGMRKLSLHIALLCSVFVASLVDGRQPCNSKTIVDLGYSRYEGTALSSGVTQWLGMRFAAPPVGDLRWKAPENPRHEKGIQKADKVSNGDRNLTQVWSIDLTVFTIYIPHILSIRPRLM